MNAIIEDGSRQYLVEEGDVIKLDYRAAEEGDPIELPRVLLYKNGDDVQIGRPALEGARVLAEVIDHPSVKTYIQKFRRRKNYRRFKGHRQFFTRVVINHILLAGQQPPPPEQEESLSEQSAGQEGHG
jgi:large subunit ribosomal protein L21